MSSHLEKVKANQKQKYSNNIYWNLIQRYQARINSFFGEQKYTALDLLGCSDSFFKDWLEFSNTSGLDLFDIEIDHVNPLAEITDKNNEAYPRQLIYHFSE